MATNPVATKAYADRMAEQNAARIFTLEDLAGTGGARDLLAGSRADAAKSLYDDAMAQGVDPARLTPDVMGKIKLLLGRPSIKSAMDQAKQLAAEEGLELNDMTSIQGLHYVKQALDDQISASARAGTNTLTNKLMGTKDLLEKTMTQISPAYAKARETYAAMSAPINQMDVAQAIIDKSVNPLTGNISPQAFARNLSDATAQRATGFEGATLDNTMTPEQLATLNAVKEDLARAEFARSAGRGAGSDTVQKLAYANMVDGVNVPAMVRNLVPTQAAGNVAARIADTVYGGANKELSAKLSEAVLDPNATSNMIKDALDAVDRSGFISRGAASIAPITGITTGLLGANASNSAQ